MRLKLGKLPLFAILITPTMTLKRLFFLAACTLLWILPAHAQSVELHAVVTLNNGQTQTFYLTEEDRFSFDGQESLVIHTQGSTTNIAIDDIRKIEFTDVTGTQELTADSPFFYPNPVKKAIILGNIDDNQIVTLYSLEGRLVRQFKAVANEPIDLGNLPAGIYTLNINDKNLKLLKL